MDLSHTYALATFELNYLTYAPNIMIYYTKKVKLATKWPCFHGYRTWYEAVQSRTPLAVRRILEDHEMLEHII